MAVPLDVEDPKNPRAFPGESKNHYLLGMTLRDYFAAAALQGLIANHGNSDRKYRAETAYQFADAMLAERLKPNLCKCVNCDIHK